MANVKTLKKGNIPVKRQFNMAVIGQKKANYTATILVTLLVGVLAVAGIKFGVIDRLQKASDAEAQVTEMQAQVDMAYAKIASYGDITTAYAHYTYSDMSDQELALVEAMDVIEMLEENLMGKATIGEWTLSGNVLTIPMVTNTLEEANVLVQNLQASSPIVDFCTVTTAASVTEEVEAEAVEDVEGAEATPDTNGTATAGTGNAEETTAEAEPDTVETVTAQITIYLVQPEEEE